MTSWSAIVVSQGDRPRPLAAALDSLLAQQGVSLEVIVVGAGWEPSGLPPGVVAVPLRGNVGAPAGRNKGIAAASGEYLYFLDDDASLPDATTPVAIGPAVSVVSSKRWA